MMRKTERLALFLMPFVLATAALAFRPNRTVEIDTNSVFPPGDWSFSARPFIGEGYKTRPVVVTSVASEMTNLSVVKVRVNNISSKPVVGIKFGWFLTSDKDRNKILRQGETPLVLIEPVLAVASTCVVKPTIDSFLEINRSLVRKGRLDGNYRLEVAVTELLFSDRSTWRVGQDVAISVGKQKHFAKVAFSGKPTLTVTPLVVQDPCNKTACVYLSPPGYYTCDGTSDEVACVICLSFCCNTVCGFEPVCGPCS